ncbi:MAG TPA: S8 family serine peptidase [Trebonia sp.]|nr:S8 family serine peptidase [Trebonia sp.]
MKWYFQPRPDGGGAARDNDDDSPPGLLDLPASLLERHGGRVLNPARAVVVHGYPRPRPTVYRARTLLVPDDLQQDNGFITDVNEVLRLAGMRLVPPGGIVDADLAAGDGDQQVFEELGRLPRPAALVPLAGYGHPVEIDAWTALQTLRAAAVQGEQVADEGSTDAKRLIIIDKASVDRIELEHLLIGSPITGSPVDEGGGGITGGPGSGGDASGPSTTSSYLFSGGDPRTPVAVLVKPPSRRRDATCASRYGRRPVIAVLDTGVRAHEWLDVGVNPAGGYTMSPTGFVTWDERIQDHIREESERARTNGDKPRQVIENAWDEPIADSPLIGELNEALGHGTFIAGIVRQVAPEARVLAVRVMHSDDILYEGDIICALGHLAKRIARARPGDPAAHVDVVSLSLGYFSESAHDKVVTSGLWQAIKVLLSLGVVVVAAAGNYATTRKFYPAAFALEPVPAGQVPVISVGALNPNGTKAVFTNDGHWVTAWAVGACVVSTYPIDADASRTPQLRIPVNRMSSGQWPPGREALDPNDYSAGFALWSGTSFSAPYGAALIAKSLLKGAKPVGSALKLDNPGTGEKRRRAVAACSNLPRRIP